VSINPSYVDDLEQRLKEAEDRADHWADLAETYKEVLDDLWFCHDEQEAIGGGPGWQERDRKAWARAAELYEP
jgi:hypothetical protein